jgi:hypothetical protein
MELVKQNQIREALRQLALAHAATTRQMEQAMSLLAEALQLDEDFGKPASSPKLTPPESFRSIDRFFA